MGNQQLTHEQNKERKKKKKALTILKRLLTSKSSLLWSSTSTSPLAVTSHIAEVFKILKNSYNKH